VSRFSGPAEFRKVFDLLFTFLSRDARFGPKLKALEKPQRFVITDLKLTLDVAGSADAKKPGESLRWSWNGKGRDWAPAVVLELDADTASAFFQGKVNLPKALFTGAIRISDGSASVPLETLPILHAFHPLWAARIRHEGWDHLVA
jgi:hypothetical protein